MQDEEELSKFSVALCFPLPSQRLDCVGRRFFEQVIKIDFVDNQVDNKGAAAHDKMLLTKYNRTPWQNI